MFLEIIMIFVLLFPEKGPEVDQNKHVYPFHRKRLADFREVMRL